MDDDFDLGVRLHVTHGDAIELVAEGTFDDATD
jgi:hypothetical protein